MGRRGRAYYHVATGARFHPQVRLLKPLGFHDYVNLQMQAKAVLSDSGTISEESSILGIPAITIRDSMERPEALEVAGVVMTGLKRDNVIAGLKEVIANPGAAIAYVKERDGIVNTQLETRRLQLAIDTVVNSADARAEGFGQAKPGRLSLMASQVSDAFNTKTRVNADDVWNPSFLPPAAELNILPKK
mgnify:CR=1 FL=1